MIMQLVIIQLIIGMVNVNVDINSVGNKLLDIKVYQLNGKKNIKNILLSLFLIMIRIKNWFNDFL